MWWLWLLGFFVLLVLVLLFAPIKLKLSTISSRYYFSFAWVFKVSVFFLDDDIAIYFHILGYRKGISLIENLAKHKRKKSIPEKVAESVVKQTKKRMPIKALYGMMKTFRIKKFHVDVDLGSVYYNAWLFPLGEIFKSDRVRFTTNFIGNTTLDIELLNRPAYLIWAGINTQFKTK